MIQTGGSYLARHHSSIVRLRPHTHDDAFLRDNLYFGNEYLWTITEPQPTLLDIHSHILPGIDDGASSLDVSIAMLDAARTIGIRSIIATPHLTGPLSEAYDDEVRAALNLIEPHARERNIVIERGFEIRLSPDLLLRLREGEASTLAGTNVVLVDLPFIDWPLYADDTIFALQAAGFQPILAHPERYPRIQKSPGFGLEIAQRGVALQVNIASLTGLFGRQARRAAEDLLKLGAVHLAATDAHSAGHRMAAVPEGMNRLRDLVGEEGLNRLVTENPASLLNGDPLPAPVVAREKVGSGFLHRVRATIG